MIRYENVESLLERVSVLLQSERVNKRLQCLCFVLKLGTLI